MRILLVEPPFYRLYNKTFSLDKFPLSLGYLSAYLAQRTAYEIKIYNADFCPDSKPMLHEYLAGEGFRNYLKNIQDGIYSVWQEVEAAIRESSPDIVGISAKSQNFKSALKVAEIVKRVSSKTIVVIGGPHPSLVKGDVIISPFVDIAVVGEGEVTFHELVDAIYSNKTLEGIPGIIFRKEDKTVVGPQRPFIKFLEELPNPYNRVKEVLKDFDLYPLTAFRSVFATRGCPFNCTFCGSHAIWSRKVRFRPVANVVDEIKFLQSLGCNYINFDDDTFGVTKQYLLELCDEIRHKCRGLLWSCEIHIKLLDKEVLRSMKKAGCDLIKIGIESGNNVILKEINKHITIEEALEASNRIHKAGIHVMSFFMVGFPQETEKSINDTLQAIKKIRGYTTYSIFTPYIGTHAYEQCKGMGLIPEEFDVSLYNHQSPSNSFCKNITHDRFREMASEIEKTVDEKNKLYEKHIKYRRYTPAYITRKLIKKVFG